MLRSVTFLLLLIVNGSFLPEQDLKTFPQLYFKENSAILNSPFPQYNSEFGFSDFKDSLEAFTFVIQKFKKYPKMKLQIQGYVDFMEKDPMKLTEQRVKKVRACLMSQGIDSTQLPMVWDRYSILLNSKEEIQSKCKGEKTCVEKCHQENRRVFFSVKSLK